MGIRNVRSAVTIFVALLPHALSAHHSVNAFYDLDDPISVEGTLTFVRWANPHVLLRMDGVGPDGEMRHWVIDSGGPTLLRRLGVTAELVGVGDRITISGFPSKFEDAEMIGVSIGLADGREMPMFPTLAARFGHQIRFGAHITEDAIVASERSARSIYRVWTLQRDPAPPAFEPQFTAAALRMRASYDPVTDDPALQCIAPGMPSVMDNPFPIEFVDDGDAILLKLEIWDVVRAIDMRERALPTSDATPLGHSVGYWEDRTLVVETTNIDWRYFDDEGTPQSDAMHVLERFTLSEDERSLGYEVVMTDPETLVEPAVRYARWTWVEGEALQSYGCTLSDE